MSSRVTLSSSSCGLLDWAKARGVETVAGLYAPTATNAVVADLYERLGFESIGERRWSRVVAGSTEDLVTYVDRERPRATDA